MTIGPPPARTPARDVTARLVGAVAGAAVWAATSGRGSPWADLSDGGA